MRLSLVGREKNLRLDENGGWQKRAKKADTFTRSGIAGIQYQTNARAEERHEFLWEMFADGGALR